MRNTSFVNRLEESRTVIDFAQNLHANASTPVNTIPPEILARIFSILVNQSREAMEISLYRDGMDSSRSYRYRLAAWKYPDILAHVCSYWRRAAIQSRPIWGNIDITTLQASVSRFNSKAKAHINRAGQSLLDVYIYDIDPMEEDECLSKRTDPIPLMFPPSVRIRSLIYHTYHLPSDRVCRSILSNCLAKSTDGMLTKLVLNQQCDFVHDSRIFPVAFLKPAEAHTFNHTPTAGGIDGNGLATQNAQELDILRLTVPETQFEKILLGLTTLRCSEIYPYWTSKAYCCLTELRLIGPDPNDSGIDEPHFVNMLKSSPNLRVFEFNLSITNTATEVTIGHGDLIFFPKLEVLNLCWKWEEQTETVLRWFLPITNPLQLSITDEEYGLDLSAGATKNFLSASNITMFHTKVYQHIDCTIAYLPTTLRTLAVEFGCSSEATLPEFETTRLQLEELYLIHSNYEIDQLRLFLKSLSTQEVIFYASKFETSDQEVTVALADVCSKVTILPANDINPICDRELFVPRSSRGI